MIEVLYNCPKFEAYCKKLTKNNDLWQDLRSETILRIYEQPENKFTNEKDILSYAYTTAFCEWINKYSKLNKGLGKEISIEDTTENNKQEAIEFISEQNYNLTLNIIEKDLIKEIRKNKFPVEHYFFQAYLEHKTIRATAKFFNVSRSTTHRIIKGYKDKIKQIANEKINR